MSIWLTVLILAAQSSAPGAQRGAEVVYATGFEQEADTDFDGWPDNWTRRRGQGYPQYLNIGIADDPAGETSHCLRIELDGGAAMLCSPPIRINPKYNYLLQGKLKTELLKHDVVYYSVTFLDSKQQPKESYNSPEFTLAPAWQDVQIGPLTPTDPEARFAVINLHVMPTDRADLQGAAMFDDIRFSQLPRMTISSRQPQNLFFDPAQVKVTCYVSGIPQLNPTLHLELLDVTGRSVDSATLPMDRAVESGDQRATDDVPNGPSPEDPGHGGFAGSLTWSPKVPAYGFYRVRAALEQDGNTALQHTVSLVVMRPATGNSRGEFGWTLLSGETPLAMQPLLELLEQAHVGWLKYPVWCDPADTRELDRLATLADRLSTSGIEMVGVFDAVPASIRQQFGHKEHLTVAEAFLRPEIWQPIVEPLMTRLSLKIRHWQIGSDADSSLADFEKLEPTIRDVRTRWKQAGQVVRLGLAWGWMYEVPVVSDPPWDFLAMSESLPFTSTELRRYAVATTTPHSPYWITLEPLSKATYSPALRARDLVLRMLAAKVQGVPAIFVRNPFDDAHGLLNRDGTPSDLFLPWRITADLVGGATYLGSMQLPGGSRNYLFARDQEALLVVWNESPVNETLYLGDDVRQMTVWGEQCDLPSSDEQGAVTQTITAGPLPVYLTGLNLAVARWRLSCSFEPNQLASEFDRAQIARLRFRNTFPDSVGGSVSLHVPDAWETPGDSLRFRLGKDDELEQEHHVLLRAEANSGPQRVRIDFVVEAEREYRFSVYHDLQVGVGDTALELNCWLDDSDQLIVEQQLVNNSTRKLNFNCYLYAPGRRRLRQQLLDIGPGRAASTFVLPSGQELVGKTLWLRAEEIGGLRVLNYRVVAAP